MSDFYSDSKFRVVNRKWFGLTKKLGGETAAGFTIGSVASKSTHVTRFYPKGPIEILKFGAMVLATMSTPATKDEADELPALLYTNNGASLAASFDLKPADASVAVYGSTRDAFGIASSVTFNTNLGTTGVGDYLTIKTGRPQANGGTVGKGTIGGTLAFFIDWRPLYTAGNDSWDAD